MTGPIITVPRGGNGRRVARDGRIELAIEPDPGLGAYQWFHFAVTAAPDRPDPVPVLVNAAGAAYPGGWSGTMIWQRRDRGRWTPHPARLDDGVLRLPPAAAGQVTAYALFPPWRAARLRRFAGTPTGALPVAGVGPGGSLPCITLGDDRPGAEQVWILCGQHGGEHPALWCGEGILEGLLARAPLPAGRRVHLVPVANPRGSRRGHLRATPEGVDPNRHWGAPTDQNACAETAALRAAMARSGVDILLDIHTDFELGCVYLDVLDDWTRPPGALIRRREAFEAALAARSPDVTAGRRYPWAAAPEPGLLAGMCAPAIERLFGAVAMTLELPIGRYRDAAGRPGIWTPDHSRRLGRAVAETLLAFPSGRHGPRERSNLSK